MARVCVVGNATRDLNRSQDQLFSRRRPGGTLLYASLALHALGHQVRPLGHAPLRAYLWLRRAGLDVSGLHLAFPGTQFLNEYDGSQRRQWARPGPRSALPDGESLDGNQAVLLGPVLGEVPADAHLPAGVPSLLDVQGTLRRVGQANLLGWREVKLREDQVRLAPTTHARGSLEEVAVLTGRQDPDEAARALAESTGGVAVVTLAEQGAVGFDGELVRARPQALAVEDPTGAGDVFDAGLLHGLVEGESLARCLQLGSAAAGVFLERGWGVDPVDRFGSLGSVEDRADEVAVD